MNPTGPAAGSSENPQSPVQTRRRLPIGTLELRGWKWSWLMSISALRIPRAQERCSLWVRTPSWKHFDFDLISPWESEYQLGAERSLQVQIQWKSLDIYQQKVMPNPIDIHLCPFQLFKLLSTFHIDILWYHLYRCTSQDITRYQWSQDPWAEQLTPHRRRRTHDALRVKDRGGALDQLHEIRCAGLGVSFFVGRGFDNMDEVFWRRRLLWWPSHKFIYFDIFHQKQGMILTWFDWFLHVWRFEPQKWVAYIYIYTVHTHMIAIQWCFYHFTS